MATESKIDDKNLSTQDNLLIDLQTVYNFIKQNEALKAQLEANLDTYIAKEIEAIKGPQKNGRPSKLKKLDIIEKTTDSIIERIKRA